MLVVIVVVSAVIVVVSSNDNGCATVVVGIGNLEAPLLQRLVVVKWCCQQLWW